jgi:hypothetical protein
LTMDVEKLNIKTRLEGRLIRCSRRDKYSRRPLPRTLSPVSDADLLLRVQSTLCAITRHGSCLVPLWNHNPVSHSRPCSVCTVRYFCGDGNPFHSPTSTDMGTVDSGYTVIFWSPQQNLYVYTVPGYLFISVYRSI